MTKRIYLWLICAVVGLTACTLATDPVPAGPIETGALPGEATVPEQPPDLLNGQQIFEERCAACHGVEGRGDGELAEEIESQGGQVGNIADPDRAYTQSPQEWYSIITNGNIQALMPPWREALSDQERWDVTYYLYTLSLGDEELQEGQAIFEEYAVDDSGVDLTDLETNAGLSREDIVDLLLDSAEISLAEKQTAAAYAQSVAFADALSELEEGASLAEEEVAPADIEEELLEEADPIEEQAEETGGGQGEITGIIENASGDTLPEDIEIQLAGVRITADEQLEEFLVRSTSPEPDGSYAFDNVPFELEGEGAYLVSVFYEGIEYNNGSVIEPGTESLDLPITLYDSTTDPSVVLVDRMDVIVRQDPDALFVIEIMQYSNISEQVFVTPDPIVGGRRGSVSLQVPLDAFGVEFGDGTIGNRYIAEEDGTIYDMQPLFPGDGTKSILLTYFVPYDSAREISLTAEYDISLFNLLVQEGPRVRAETLEERGVEVIEGTAYEQYFGQGISAGEVVLFRVQSRGGVSDLLPVFIAAAILILVTAGIVYRLIWGPKEPLIKASRPALKAYSEAQLALAQELVELESEFTSGKIDRFQYEADRALLRAELADSFR